MDIDFVITWVDMSDPEWRKSFAKYSGKIDHRKNAVSEARFRDNNLLKYWFRGVEKFAPWVRKIHFVTCGQRPEWLNTDHPKLQVVNHEDYIPKTFLPTFNSHVIELFIHKISDLSERFVYFNDDFFLTNHTPKERFFREGIPQDIAAFRINLGLSLWTKCLKNNIAAINRRFDKKQVLNRDHDKWYNSIYGDKARLTYLLSWYDKFITLRTPHNAQPYLKKTFSEVWDYMRVELEAVAHNRFRTAKDYTPELFRTWQICQSDFNPYNTYNDTKMFPLLFRAKKAMRAIREQSYALVCLNDNEHIMEYDLMMKNIAKEFQRILPERSSFER